MDWMRLNCHSTKCTSFSGINWGNIFPFGLWGLWLHHNSVVFGQEGVRNDLKQDVVAKATEFSLLGVNARTKDLRTTIKIHWQCPLENWIKLNTDGLSLGNPGLAGGGGLLCNTNGDWMKGFARAIRVTTSAAAELWALRDGIQLCIALKIHAMIIELDVKIVVDLLQKETHNQNGLDAILGDCRAGLREIPRVQIQHCYREANKCADALARRGALLPQDFVVFLEPPSDVALLICLDKAGVTSDRIVNVPGIDVV